MMKKALILATCFMCSCRSTGVFKSDQHITPAPSSGPMSCGIAGQIIRVIKTVDTDTGSMCHKYPCRALVKILDAPSCGSSVSATFNQGDTVEMKFAYTLHNTKGLFPNMKAEYPGLKKGDIFTAAAEQRLAPGTQGVWVVYGYDKK